MSALISCLRFPCSPSTLYNEVFGIPVDFFTSRWGDYGNAKVLTGIDTCGLALDKENCSLPPQSIYPYGMDPAWKWADNGLTFNNSLKMKMSVILGVTQMLFGIILKMTNALHFKNPLDLYCEFFPQVKEKTPRF